MRPVAILFGLAAFGTVLGHGATLASADPVSGSATLSVCIDSASATASRDEAVARQAATRETLGLTIHRFDSSDDDEGLGEAGFRRLLATQCDLVMGYPVDRTGGTAPFGLSITAPYGQTGFVLATTPPLRANGLGTLPPDTLVAVTFGAVPNLYFVTYRALQSDIELSEDATLHALTGGHVKAAMLWQPDIDAYLATHPGTPIRVQPLAEPHARFDIVALYGKRGAAAARRFQDGLAAPRKSGSAARDGARRFGLRQAVPFLQLAAAVSGGAAADVPALYTDVQAKAGAQKYGDDCAQCHGATLDGQSGPALKGRLFASVKTGFTVGDILNFMAVNMPATQPGSLSHDDYTDIMAYVLAQNGFPAGARALDFDGGTQSKVPLLYHGP